MMTEEHDPALEAALRRLERDTAGPLEAWSEARQAEVDALIQETNAADRGLSVETFEELSGRRLRRRLAPTLAAAAALAAGLLGGFFGRGLLEQPAYPAPRTTLGTQSRSGAEAPYPGDGVDDYDVFAWPVGEGQRRWGLRVWNEGREEPALQINGLTEPSYRPTDKELARLGKVIHWEVVWQDESGQSLDLLFSVSASRSL